MTFTYIFEAQTHSDTSSGYMNALGMTEEQIESVLLQQDFELSQNKTKRVKAYKEESDGLYMEWQFDQTPEAEQAWRDKVVEIKNRYPLVR